MTMLLFVDIDYRYIENVMWPTFKYIQTFKTREIRETSNLPTVFPYVRAPLATNTLICIFIATRINHFLVTVIIKKNWCDYIRKYHSFGWPFHLISHMNKLVSIQLFCIFCENLWTFVSIICAHTLYVLQHWMDTPLVKISSAHLRLLFCEALWASLFLKHMPSSFFEGGHALPPDSSRGRSQSQTRRGLSSTATPAATPPSACSELLVRSRWPTHSFITISFPCLQKNLNETWHIWVSNLQSLIHKLIHAKPLHDLMCLPDISSKDAQLT